MPRTIRILAVLLVFAIGCCIGQSYELYKLFAKYAALNNAYAALCDMKIYDRTMPANAKLQALMRGSPH